eukprot:gene1825-2159_t
MLTSSLFKPDVFPGVVGPAFSESLKPNLVIPSGSEVTVEMITHHAGDDPDKMIKGDPGVEAIYEWGAKMGISARGATGQEPGDVLQVDILDLYPRKNPKTGKVSLTGSSRLDPDHLAASAAN